MTVAWTWVLEHDEQATWPMQQRQIWYLQLSYRARRCLCDAGITTVKDLLEQKEGDLIRIMGLGRKTLGEIQHFIQGLA